MSIVIIDYGSGNLRSVQKALQKFSFPAIISKDKSAIHGAKGIILPGVGSFDDAIKELRVLGLEGVIEESIALGKPFLGICLGLQLLFESSEEGKERGLGLLDGTVKKLAGNGTLKVPHMGWNRIVFKHRSPIFEGIESGEMMYFVHSYYAVPQDETIVTTTTDYGIDFVSAICKENIYGVQFHIEKSGDQGLKILRNFGNICTSPPNPLSNRIGEGEIY